MNELEALIDRSIRIKLRGACCKHLEEEARRIQKVLMANGEFTDQLFKEVARKYHEAGWIKRLSMDKEEADLLIWAIKHFAQLALDAYNTSPADLLAAPILGQIRNEAQALLDMKEFDDHTIYMALDRDPWARTFWRAYRAKECQSGNCMDFLNRG